MRVEAQGKPRRLIFSEGSSGYSLLKYFLRAEFSSDPFQRAQVHILPIKGNMQSFLALYAI